MMDKNECSFWQRGNGDVVRTPAGPLSTMNSKLCEQSPDHAQLVTIHPTMTNIGERNGG